MKSTVETLSPTRVRLAIEVPFDELKPSLQKAYREIGSQVQIPGFRRGKIPAAVIDQRVGRGAVLNEAVQEAIPQQILAAVREHDVKTLGRPEVEITEFADGEPLKFTAEVDVRPEITHSGPVRHHGHRAGRRDRRQRDRRADQRAARAVRHAQDRRPAGRGGRLRPARPQGDRGRRGGAGRLGHQHLPRGGQQAAAPGPGRGAGRPGRRRRRHASPPSWSAATSPAGTPRSR